MRNTSDVTSAPNTDQKPTTIDTLLQSDQFNDIFLDALPEQYDRGFFEKALEAMHQWNMSGEQLQSVLNVCMHKSFTHNFHVWVHQNKLSIDWLSAYESSGISYLQILIIRQAFVNRSSAVLDASLGVPEHTRESDQDIPIQFDTINLAHILEHGACIMPNLYSIGSHYVHLHDNTSTVYSRNRTPINQIRQLTCIDDDNNKELLLIDQKLGLMVKKGLLFS